MCTATASEIEINRRKEHGVHRFTLNQPHTQANIKANGIKFPFFTALVCWFAFSPFIFQICWCVSERAIVWMWMCTRLYRGVHVKNYPHLGTDVSCSLCCKTQRVTRTTAQGKFSSQELDDYVSIFKPLMLPSLLRCCCCRLCRLCVLVCIGSLCRLFEMFDKIHFVFRKLWARQNNIDGKWEKKRMRWDEKNNK